MFASVARSGIHGGLENGVGDVCEPWSIHLPLNFSFKMSQAARKKYAVL